MKLAIVFPGYGSQFVGMAKELYDKYRIVQEYFEEAANCLNENFVKLCFASSDAELARIQNAYTSLFLVECALLELLKQEGITPHAVVGYNQGEYSALFAAGGISFPDGLYLLKKYATIHEEMLVQLDAQIARVVGPSTAQLKKMCTRASTKEDQIYVAIYFDATTHYIVGHAKVMARVRAIFDEDSSIAVTPEPLEIGLHSPLADPVYNNFKMYLEKVDCRDLAVSFLNDIETGADTKKEPKKEDASQDGAMTSCSLVKEYIADHIRQPINWVKMVASLSSYDGIIEVGPGTFLSTHLKEVYPHKIICALNSANDLESIKKLFIKSSEQTEKPQEDPIQEPPND